MHTFLAIIGLLIFVALMIIAAVLFHITQVLESLVALLEPSLSRVGYLQKFLMNTSYGRFSSDLSGLKATTDRFMATLTDKEREVLERQRTAFRTGKSSQTPSMGIDETNTQAPTRG